MALATRHGILTPYTSFLADEITNVRDLASVRLRAGVELEALRETSGASAFGQRLMKSQMQQAERAPASAADNLRFLQDASTMPGQPGLGGMASPASGAAGGGRAAGSSSFGRASGAGGYPAPAAAESDRFAVTRTTRNVGKKTFFWRNERWEDSVLTEAQLKALKTVKLYSQEYFDLVTQHGKDVAKYLATDDDLVIVLAGQAYVFSQE